MRRLYESLLEQTAYDFEWIVVDDESTDDTQLFLEKVRNMNAPFPIRTFRQKHGGKHRAINLALDHAKGDYFFIVDSDDWLPNNAIALLTKWLKEIEGIPHLCGVAGQKALADGKPVGSSFASDEAFIDASNFERKKLHIEGDKAEVFDTEVLRAHPFPEFDGEFFVTEAVCWNAIAADVTGLSIDVLTCPDASATGAALIALAGSTGGNLYEIAAGTLQVAYTVRPRAERTARYRRLFPLYKKLYSAVSDLEAEMQAEKD